MADEIDPRELRRFGDALARPAVRKAFELNPILALESAGVDLKNVPDEVVDLFAELTPEELDVVGRVAARAKGMTELAKVRDHVGVIIH